MSAMRILKSLAAVTVLLGAAGAASAHHSFAMFDQTRTVDITGIVGEVQWTNPHVWIMVDVPGEDGASVRWGVEFTSRVHLTRRGFKPEMIHPGDEVTFSVNPYADGSPGGRFVRVRLADGNYYCSLWQACDPDD
jgi:hypothetical protein